MARTIQMRVLPDGKVRIHYFVHDDAGPIRTPGKVIAMTPLGPLRAGGVKGYIACQPKRDSALPGRVAGGEIQVMPHSNEARAVTCPECKATDVWKKTMALLGETLETAR